MFDNHDLPYTLDIPKEAFDSFLCGIFSKLEENPEDPQMTIYMLRTIGKYTETGNSLTEELQTKAYKHCKKQKPLLNFILNGTEYEGLKDMMIFFQREDYINWRDRDNLDHLLMVNEFYTALMGYYTILGEDPTKGWAFDLLEKAITSVKKNPKVFAGAKEPIFFRLFNNLSINPVNKLWAEIAGHSLAEA